MKAEIREMTGAPCYCFGENGVKAAVRVVSGQLSARFAIGGREIDPFYYIPWWKDGYDDLSASNSYLRGAWFTFPHGVNKPFGDIRYPVHGFTGEGAYRQVSLEQAEHGLTLTLETQLEQDAAVHTKCVTLGSGQQVIYVSDTVRGAKGRYPVGYHPTLRLPEEAGGAILDTSPPLETWTAPVFIENPAKGGYTCLRPNHKIEDMEQAPTIYGDTVNLRRHPFTQGFDDIFMQIADPGRPFVFTALSVPGEGYLYYQLKNPRSLSGLMVWASNGGRHYYPWNGRVNRCLGLEEVTSYFYFGRSSAYESNPFARKGYRTYDEFDGGERTYRLIHGIAPIPADFAGVADIVPAGPGEIKIRGVGGEEILCRCDVDFLEQNDLFGGATDSGNK